MSSAVRVCFAPIGSESDGLIAVQIAPTEIPARAPVNLCAVVDVSGSMGDLVQVKDRMGREVNDARHREARAADHRAQSRSDRPILRRCVLHRSERGA